MVELDPMDEHDFATVKDLIRRHYEYTESAVAWRVLSAWHEHMTSFVKVMPVEYRKVLKAAHLDTDTARLAAV